MTEIKGVSYLLSELLKGFGKTKYGVYPERSFVGRCFKRLIGGDVHSNMKWKFSTHHKFKPGELIVLNHEGKNVYGIVAGKNYFGKWRVSWTSSFRNKDYPFADFSLKLLPKQMGKIETQFRSFLLDKEKELWLL